jgi:hypothetical protein
MPYLPSLLEYDASKLDSTLKIISKNLEALQSFQKSPDETVYLHLDFVLPMFAKSRGVESSIDVETNLDLIEKHLDLEKVDLTIHLMGIDEDFDVIDLLIERLSNYVFDRPDWSGIVFVPTSELEDFEVIEICSNLKVGTWIDYGEYNIETKFEESKNYLLMTVKAGKSGQKLTEEGIKNVYQISENNPKSNFVADGGWKIESELKNNLDIVSYTSFWQEFDKVANLK